MSLTLRITLEPPLPNRKFIFVCKQQTVKELRNEIRRRIQPITTEPIALLYKGFELMDDDSVKDIFKLTETINVHKTDSQGVPIVLEKERKKTGESPANISKQVGQITISKRIHGSEGMEVEEGGQQVSRKKYSVEILYDKAKPVQPPGTDDSDDASDDDSDRSSSNSRCSSESEQSSKAMASNNDDDDASDSPPDTEPISKQE
ncbi:hypothetical protein LPJ64_004067 [Coemansia asiatica]|uniref:Ubiquitin-like domain-containing protein n=1 Tax=Coemansia asiatica TaxID=1052880 RepID=A0A9W7XIL4_9FUNG|nr:hypothetical protein LPJ64_004067 [Coemansia asiatica]